METIYVQPGSGSGSGILSDPYYYDDEFATAYSAAGSGGIIYLTDGTYQVAVYGGAGVAFNTTDFSDVTIIALNKHKAIMECWGTVGYFKSAKLKDIKLKEQAPGIYQSYMCYGTASDRLEMTNCVVEFFNKSLYYFVQTAGVTLKGCTFWFKSIGAAFCSIPASSLIQNCSFYIAGDDSNMSSTYDLMFKHIDTCFYDTSAGFTFRNNIFIMGETANDNLGGATQGWVKQFYADGSIFQNNCFRQNPASATQFLFSTLDLADINVGNFEADPQCLDPLNGNFGLRPNSPCLNAGYLE